MTKLRHFIILLAFSLAATLTAHVNTAACAPQDDNEVKGAVVKAFQSYANLKSYHMSIDSRASFSLQGKTYSIVTRGECDVTNKPTLMRNVLTITADAVPPNREQKIEQYVEEAGGKFIAYTKANNQWVKQELPVYNPLGGYENYFKAIKQVTPLRDTADAAVYEIVIDGSYVQENIEQAMGAVKGMIPPELYQDLGDLKYTLTLDKRAGTITKVEIELSALFAKMGDRIAEVGSLPDEQKAMIRGLFNTMKLVTTVTFSQVNGVGKLSIPQEALNAPLQKANVQPPQM